MDLSSLLGDTEPTDDEQRAAQIAALRGKSTVATAGPTPMGLPQMDPDSMEAMGLLGQLTGDRVLSPVGSSVLAQAHQRRQLDEQRQEKSLTRALAARKEAQQEAYQKGQLELRQQGLDRGKIFNGKDGETLSYDPNTREATTLRAAPPPKLGGARGGGAGGSGGAALDKALGLLRADIDPSSGKGQGLFGKDQGLVTAADKVLALVKNPDTGQVNYNLTNRQIPEMVQSVASMLSNGGVAAQAQLEHLMPATAGMSLAGKLEWLTGHPEAASVPEFVKQYSETAEREKKLAQGRIRGVQLRRLSGHRGLYGTNPAEAKAFARQYLPDLSDSDLDAAFQGAYQAPAAGPAPAGATATPQLQPGEVLMFDLKGKPHAVPQSKVDDAVLHKWRRG